MIFIWNVMCSFDASAFLNYKIRTIWFRIFSSHPPRFLPVLFPVTVCLQLTLCFYRYLCWTRILNTIARTPAHPHSSQREIGAFSRRAAPCTIWLNSHQNFMLKLTNLFTNLLKRSAARPFAGWLGGSGARNAPILSQPSSSAMSPLRR